MWSFEKLTQWIDTSLHGCMSDGWALLVEFVLIGVAVLVAYALIALFLIYAERKICGFFQCRLGPNRVGKWGIFQSVADMIKILLKELVHIDKSDKVLFRMASFFVIIGSICTFGALPFAKGLQAIDFNVGVFYLLAVSSLGVVGILLAGWSSNSKYSMIGAMRSGAQLISYEISAGLSLMVIVVFSGTMQLSEIVAQQADGWFIFKGHVPACIAFLTYLIAGHAETNRGPFDMPEAESELTAGYHTEYSGIQFGFFYLAEYLNLFIVAAIASTMFLGVAAAARSRLGGVQPRDGLHPVAAVVLRQDVRLHVPGHVGAVVVPASAHRPAAQPGMENPDARLPAQPDTHVGGRYLVAL